MKFCYDSPCLRVNNIFLQIIAISQSEVTHMNIAALKNYLDPVRQAIIGTDGNTLVYANPAAKAVLGDKIVGKPAAGLIPVEILETDAESIACSALIAGKAAAISAVRDGSLRLLYIDFDENNNADKILVSPHMTSFLRSYANGIKMSADLCFTSLNEGQLPSNKYISVLYHYYYCLIRMIMQVDSAQKLELGEFSIETVPTDLVKLCYELTDTVSSLSQSYGIDISFICEEESLVAVVDPSNIELMLLNLFSNSIKHTPAKGRITLNLSKNQGSILISLDDTGDGIPQDKLSRLFSTASDEFDMAKPTPGLGLGLYISGSIVRLHNGIMFIESREGEGTHVRIKLPASEIPSTKFNTPVKPYRSVGISPALTELADILKSDCYGPKYED